MDNLRHCFDTRLIWASWITASAVTTALLLHGEFPFPLHVLLTHLLVAQAVQLMLYATNRSRSHDYQPLPPYKTWQFIDIFSLVVSFLMAPVLISAYKTITLSNDLPNLILVLTLDWRPADLLGKILDGRLNANDVLRYLVFAAGLYLVCVCNFRLRYIPWKMSMEFLMYSGLVQVVSRWRITLNRPYLKPATEKHPALPQYWVLCSTAVVGIYLILTPEELNPDRSPLSMTAMITVLSGFAAACSLFVLGPVFQKSENAEQSVVDENHSGGAGGAEIRLAIAGFTILMDSILSPGPLNISIWQCLGYAMASLAFLTSEETERGLQVLAKRKNELFQSRGTAGNSITFLIIAGVAWSYALLKPLTVMPVPLEYTNLSLDPSPFPASDLDIVISRYAESAVDVAQTLDQLLAVDSVRAVHARVIVYNKNTDTLEFERDLIASLTSNVSVSCHALENIGREADTYIRHILAEWDTLATHTLFAQAEMDGFPTVLEWINTFFIPETGFLQLAYEGRMCADCAHCGSWTDDPNVIFAMYHLANPNRQCRDLVWTYRGQFIASGARIRANGKDVYEHLLRNLTDPENEMHAPKYAQGIWHSAQNDSLNDPVFGFTVERFWGVMMQCSEPRVGHQSPSQLAVSIRPQWLAGGFSHDDAQCLDRFRG